MVLQKQIETERETQNEAKAISIPRYKTGKRERYYEIWLAQINSATGNVCRTSFRKSG